MITPPEPSDLIKDIGHAKPDSYYTLKNGKKLPRYEKYLIGLRDWKNIHASTLAKSKEEYLSKLKRRMRRTETAFKNASSLLMLNDKSTIMDLGAGFGIEALLMRLNTRAKILAVDREIRHHSVLYTTDSRKWISNLCELCSWNIPDDKNIDEFFNSLLINWIKASADSIPVADESVDFIYSMFSLEHFVNTEDCINEIHRILKKGGIFYCSWSNFYSPIGAHKRGIIDIPWGHVFLDKYELIAAIKRLDCSLTKRDEKMIVELNTFTPCEWKKVFSKKSWNIIEWNDLRMELSKSDMPEWISNALPIGVSIDDILIEDFEVLIVKT